MSCRTMYEIATHCREVLVHHLQRTPGALPADLRSMHAKELFQLLLRQASQQLYGAQFHADCVTFKPWISSLDVKASIVVRREILTLALVFREQDCIHLFQVIGGGLRPQARLELQWCRPGAVEILKTAFDGDDTLYILHRFRPSLNDSDDYARHPFVRHAMQLGTDTTVYLSRYSIESPHGPVRICAFPDHADYEPLALAAARGGIFAISWQHAQDISDLEVTLYICSSESNCDMRPGVIGRPLCVIAAKAAGADIT